MRWRSEQDLPEPPADQPDALDPQLEKAFALLRARLASE
jgi:hypothetical protein